MTQTAPHPETQIPLPAGAMLIDGEWVAESSLGRQEQVNPATGKVLATFALAGQPEVDAAVAAARGAFPAWRAMPPNERRTILSRLASLLDERVEHQSVLRTLETGAPLKRGKRQSLAAEWIHYYAGWVDKLEGQTIPAYPGQGLDYTKVEPYGVVAVIIPWNGPVVSAAMKVAPALAAGNCVVLKPSELGPLATLHLGELCIEAGIPPGVINIVPGGPEAGETLVSHPGVEKISFTGGGATARRILTSAAEHLTPVVLELGGKSASVVFADADLDRAAMIGLHGGIVNMSGQACVLATRMLVEASVYEEMERRVVDMVEALKVGDPFVDGTQMGPVISAGAADRILGEVDRAASDGDGKLLTGGSRLGGDLADGYFVAPTVFGGVDNASPLAQEEIFGPVLSLIPFDTEDDAIEKANDTRYGLGSLVFTRDLRRAHQVADRLDAGYLGINAFPPMSPNAPFGGVKQSGFGREGGLAGIQEFLRVKNIYVDLS